MINKLNTLKMKKIAVFEGIINGERFDNVQAYNARMNALVESGCTDIQASSSTSIKMVEDTFNPEDQDLTFYPYFEESDPKYLDILVTMDENTNAEARAEVNRLLDKNYLYITNHLYSPDVDLNTKEAYLSDVRNIISHLKHDLTDNDYAIANVRTRGDNATARFESAKAEYDTTIQKCNDDLFILNAAKPVVESLLDFYRRIEADAMHCIVEQRSAQFAGEETACPNCGNANCTCGVECTCTETVPQVEAPIENWYERILRECGLR